MQWLFEWNSTLRNVLVGSAILGVVGGVMGSFALLRRQSLLGDALAHAALPGVCIAFLLTGSKAPSGLFLGALVAGVLGALFVLIIVRGSRVKEDSAIGIVLSVFFGIGIVLLTYIQNLPLGSQSGLDTYLFGQAATLLREDIRVMAIVGAIVLVLVGLCFKEFKLLAFDREFGASVGFPMRGLEVLLTVLLVVVVVIGLRTVGVILMVATLITPAAAARQWARSLGSMALLAGAIGGVCGAAGALLSAGVPHLPTGPTIVLFSSAILAVSIILAPGRGVVWSWLRARRLTDRVRRENLLKDIYRIGEAANDWEAAVSLERLQSARGQAGQGGPARATVARTAQALERSAQVERLTGGWRLTADGVESAERVVRKHRLWELFLTRRLDLPSDHVHRDAEAMEHTLTDEDVLELERTLGNPSVDPHGRPIPPARRDPDADQGPETGRGPGAPIPEEGAN